MEEERKDSGDKNVKEGGMGVRDESTVRLERSHHTASHEEKAYKAESHPKGQHKRKGKRECRNRNPRD